MDPESIERQSKQDRRYDEAFKTWWAGLSPADRAAAIAKGIKGPSCKYEVAHDPELDHDPEDPDQPRPSDVVAEAPEDPEAELRRLRAENETLRFQRDHLLERMLRLLIHDHPHTSPQFRDHIRAGYRRLAVLAWQLHPTWFGRPTMVQLAAALGMNKRAVSVVAQHNSATFGIRSPHQASKAAAAAQRRREAREGGRGSRVLPGPGSPGGRSDRPAHS